MIARPPPPRAPRVLTMGLKLVAGLGLVACIGAAVAAPNIPSSELPGALRPEMLADGSSGRINALGTSEVIGFAGALDESSVASGWPFDAL